MITTTTYFGLFLPMIDDIKLNDSFIVCTDNYDEEDENRYQTNPDDYLNVPQTVSMDDIAEMRLDTNNMDVSDDILMHSFIFYIADNQPEAFHVAYSSFDELKAECRDNLLTCGNSKQTVAYLLGADVFNEPSDTYGQAESGVLTAID